MRDLSAIRTAYQNGEGSLRALAERFAVPFDTLKKRAAREKWHQGATGGRENGTDNGTASAQNGTTPRHGAKIAAENGTDNGTTVDQNGTAPGHGAKTASENGTDNGTSSEHGAKNGTENGTAPVRNGTKNGTASENGTKNGTKEAHGAKTGKKSGTGAISGTVPSIPDSINTLNRLEAARFYAGELGWAVHPLNPPDRGDHHERGKKPLLKGWRNHTAAEISPDFLSKYFANGSSHNIGCVVRAPFVHVDLDSKPDAGESVQQWLATQADLAAVPRERTGGGAHLVFLCRDVPEEVLKSKKAPSSQITEAVTAELYVDGLNIVLSPSVHKNGHTYVWETTGAIPEVKWSDLSRWFGFATPEAKRRGRPPKEKPWWSKWPQDLRTLDLTAVLKELGLLGECLDPDASKWALRCPWESSHTGGVSDTPGSDTAIFNQPETMPAFRCLHSHCDERGAGDLLEWIEEQRPGLIAQHCTDLRVWTPGNQTPEGRPRIILPGTGRSHSEFADEMGKAIAPALDLFRFSRNVVEITSVPAADASGAIPGHMLSSMKAADLVTAVERTVETGLLQKDEAGDVVFAPKSMTEHDARITLVSGHFTSLLPRITRVLDVPVPMLDESGALIFPQAGYDARFGTWLNPQPPELRTMGFKEALQWVLGDLFTTPDRGGFWWHDEQSRVHALARVITPFCRGLMGWKRSPLWIYDGNREGCGKDTCADVTHVLYTGRSIICAPLSKDCDEEMRKRITSALLSGARFFHLANMKGHVRYASLEAATDNSGTWEDRRLGVSETLVLPNETEFSFSANNATWEPDIERRCRRIRLRFTPDDINGHRYRHANLLSWVREHRSDLLSAINALVSHWVRQGCPPGPTPFTSFPEWGRIVGGVLTTCGLPDPCLPHEESANSGDQNTRAMRDFYAVAHRNFGDDWIQKAKLHEFVQESEEVQDLFEWIEFAARRGLITFGKLLSKFDGRELGGIVFRIDRTSKNYCKYRFFRPEDELLPTHPTPPTGEAPSSGMWDEMGQSHHARIGEEKFVKNLEKEKTLNGSLYSDREIVPKHPTSHKPVFCSTRGDLDRVAADLSLSDGRIALDLETYGNRKGDGLDPWRGDIRLLTVCREGGPVWMLDLMAIGYELGPLATILASAPVIAHNAKFDALWLRVKCGLGLPKVFCTLTAARLLAAGTKPGNNLDQCLERFLGIEPGKDQSRSDWGSMLLTEEQFAYAARDVAHLHDLAKALETGIEDAALERVWTLESALLPRVVEMEAAGIRVDVEKLREIATDAKAHAAKASADLREALGAPSLNPASPAQLLAALRSQGIALESTAEESLKAADDGRIIPLILAHREASKRGQQAESLIEHVKTDGRIHARFEPTGTATGRFSSKEPNLQNVGRGELREAFVPAPGHRFIVADYSQVELRAAAAIAGETKMIEAYRAGADLHRRTAATVLGKPESEVSKEDRQKSKMANFGLCYGQSAPGLVRFASSSYGIALDVEEAKEIRTAFFRTYGHLRQWHGESHRQAERGVTEVRTRLGRRRLIPETASEWERFTALVNTPVQGGCADGMKQAIVTLAERLPDTARLISTVHDEVIVEVPETEAEQICGLVAATMKEAMEALFPEVPIEVEAGTCKHWGEKG